MENKLLVRLEEILQTEYEHYQELNRLAGSKTEQLTENNIEELSRLVEEEREIVSKVEDLEADRSQLVYELVEDLELEAGDINYSQLKDRLSEDWQQRLGEVRNDLLEVIDELESKNQQNRALLEEASQLNQFTFNMYRKLLEPDSKTYNKPNQKTGDNQSNHIIDRRG